MLLFIHKASFPAADCFVLHHKYTTPVRESPAVFRCRKNYFLRFLHLKDGGFLLLLFLLLFLICLLNPIIGLAAFTLVILLRLFLNIIAFKLVEHKIFQAVNGIDLIFEKYFLSL